jgi:hypothetical protein
MFDGLNSIKDVVAGRHHTLALDGKGKILLLILED